MAGACGVTVELVSAATDDVRALVGELEQELSAEYPPEQRHGLTIDAIFEPHIRFFVARLDGAAVGCGGVALYADFAEVKRMYVRESARGHGVAQALLAQIECAARGADRRGRSRRVRGSRGSRCRCCGRPPIRR
jgi:putative acetyltransferase